MGRKYIILIICKCKAGVEPEMNCKYLAEMNCKYPNFKPKDGIIVSPKQRYVWTKKMGKKLIALIKQLRLLIFS